MGPSLIEVLTICGLKTAINEGNLPFLYIFACFRPKIEILVFVDNDFKERNPREKRGKPV
jgi:hypothetical protein